jgi:hypothetical protein
LDTLTVVIITTVAASVLWGLRFGGRLPRPYFGRSCQGAGWRRAFPNASKQEIRAFLQIFVDAFAFDGIERLKLNPNDRIMDIYRALYPKKWMADALEMETLARDLQRGYELTLVDIWKDGLTLGELFECLRQKRIANAAAQPER